MSIQEWSGGSDSQDNLSERVGKRADVLPQEEEYLRELSGSTQDVYEVQVEHHNNEDDHREEKLIVPSVEDLGTLLEVERTRNGHLTDERQYEPVATSDQSEAYDLTMVYESLDDGSQKFVRTRRM